MKQQIKPERIMALGNKSPAEYDRDKKTFRACLFQVA